MNTGCLRKFGPSQTVNDNQSVIDCGKHELRDGFN